MSANSEDARECPLCLESLELDDLNFYPCTCGYQICRFCWHRIRTNENGLCPACRKQYSEDPANFRPLTAEELQQIKNVKRQKDLQKKQRLSENRKHLANVRVVQKNLVFVVGLSARVADPEELKKPTYFGKYGKIVKVIVNQTNSYAGTQGPSASAYVTYQRSEDALRAIQAVNNMKVDGRTLKSSLGTTKYCSNFLKKLQCPKQDCMYLHELGDEAASFTKEDMQAGKHQEYERKLHEQLDVNSTAQNRKQPSPVENMESGDRVPSPKLNFENSKNSEILQTGFSNTTQLQNGLEPVDEITQDDHTEIHSEEWNYTVPQQHMVTDHNQEHIAPDMDSLLNGYTNNSHLAKWQSSNMPSNSDDLLNMFNQQNRNHGSNGTMQQLKLENFQTPTEQPQQSIFLENISNQKLHSPSDQFGQTGSSSQQQECLVNGYSHDGPQQNKLGVLSWTNSQLKDFYSGQPSSSFERNSAHLVNAMPNSSEVHTSTSAFPSARNSSYPFSQHSTSLQGNPNHTFNGVNSSVVNGYDSLYSQNDMSSLYNHDDDLGFDPWHESSKGLADLLRKEKDEKAIANGYTNCIHATNRRLPVQNEPSHSNNMFMGNSVSQHSSVPPPGFQNTQFASNRSGFKMDRAAFSNKSLPLMNSYNWSTPSAAAMQFQQNMHPRNGALNNMHMRDTGIRPQTNEWQPNLANMQKKNLDFNNFGLQSQRTHSLMERVHSSTMWNNAVQTDLPWPQQEQNFLESRNVGSSQIEKMLQAIKLQSNKYNSFSMFRGGNS